MKKEGFIRNKRSQITIFVIIAIVLAAAILIIFYPKIKELIIPKTPVEMIPKECVSAAAAEGLNLTMFHGGTIKPKLYFMYKNSTLNYLCYTSEWYKTCTMQNPLLKQSLEKEALNYAKAKIQACVNQMEERLKSGGYEVKSSGSNMAEISIEPRKVSIYFNKSITAKKGDETFSLDSGRFTSEFKSGAYDMIMVASSIQNYEARYGDTVPESYMAFYPNIKVEKLKQSDGTKVYLLTERETGEKLQFAIRSLSWPPGYLAE